MDDIIKTGIWNLEIKSALENSNALCMAIFSIDGELLFANAGMKKLLKESPIESFVNPTFDSLAEANTNISPIFDGIMTIGNKYSSKNISIQAKVFKRDNQMLVIGEVDVDELVLINDKLFDLNNEINNLQRNLVKEKKELKQTLKLLRESQNIVIQSESKIRSMLEEKEIILQEVHHRIKNNMSAMQSLLFLQANTLNEPIAIKALNDASSRMQSMGILYDKLYRSTNPQELSVKDYLPLLIDDIVRNFPNSHLVKIEKHIGDFILHAEKLQPLGIIINELITNIMKYAFIGREYGLIKVSATLTGNTILLVIQDNGNGLPESIDYKTSTGFGLSLVKLLTKQLSGNIRFERINGTRVVLEFNK